MRDELSLTVSLSEMAEHHLDINLGGLLNKQTREGLLTILSLEEERYAEMLRKGGNVIQTQLKSLDKASDTIPDEDLFTLNDSHGLAPDIAVALARKAGWKNVTLRTGFSAEMAERHARMAKEAAQAAEQNDGHVELRDLPDTRLDFYDHVYSSSFEANVLASVALGDASPSGATHAVVLDCTLFYPEGGGQEADHGQLAQGDQVVNVVDVQKEGGVVVHFTNGPLKENAVVSGNLDWERRKQLMDHHTAVHIVGGAARRLLGPHIFRLVRISPLKAVDWISPTIIGWRVRSWMQWKTWQTAS